MSDPLTNKSISAGTRVQLAKEINIIDTPARAKYRPHLTDWLSHLGDDTQIKQVMPYDGGSGGFIPMDSASPPAESHYLFGSEGITVYAKEENSIPFSSMLCAGLDLSEGFNLVGIACLGQRTAFDVLAELGSQYANSIQRFSMEKGAFESAGFGPNGDLVGVDFPIVAGEGYFLLMKQNFILPPP